MPVHPHVSGGLKKVFDFFKSNEIPRDILISVGSAITGALIFDRILRRNEDEDDEDEQLMMCFDLYLPFAVKISDSGIMSIVPNPYKVNSKENTECPCGCHLSMNQANEHQVLCMSCNCAFNND